MGKQFGTVEIFAFDLHTALRPLVLKTVHDRFQFLVVPDLYRDCYKSSAQKIETKHFIISPLAPGAVRRHHLWSRYTSTEAASDPDYWKLQMPFQCQPRNADLKLASLTGLKSEIKASIWLFPLGWSTHIEFVLSGKVAAQALVTLSNELHHGKPVLLSGQERRLADVFRWFSHRLTTDIYRDFQNAYDTLKVPRHLIISLGNYSGPFEAYRPGSATGMPLTTRALMHSILLGRVISDDDLLSVEKDIEAKGGGKNKFLLTALQPENRSESPDFGITYFDHGSLLLVQKEFSSKAKRESFHCFGSNVRYFSMLALAWAAFDEEISRLEQQLQPAHLQEIKPKQQLTAFRQRYKSRFSESFFRAHKRLSLLYK